MGTLNEALGTILGGGDPRGAQIGPRLENKWKKGLARPTPWVTHFGSQNCKKKKIDLFFSILFEMRVQGSFFFDFM